jgi:integrase
MDGPAGLRVASASRRASEGVGRGAPRPAGDRRRTKFLRRRGGPVFSPHDLRHRRISLLHLGGVPWATIGQPVGQRDLAVTANTYSHVLSDERELNYERML